MAQAFPLRIRATRVGGSHKRSADWPEELSPSDHFESLSGPAEQRLRSWADGRPQTVSLERARARIRALSDFWAGMGTKKRRSHTGPELPARSLDRKRYQNRARAWIG